VIFFSFCFSIKKEKREGDIMYIVEISDDRVLKIPAEFRDFAKEGDQFDVYMLDDTIVLKKILPAFFPQRKIGGKSIRLKKSLTSRRKKAS
jgi:hypothetical protein